MFVVFGDFNLDLELNRCKRSGIGLSSDGIYTPWIVARPGISEIDKSITSFFERLENFKRLGTTAQERSLRCPSESPEPRRSLSFTWPRKKDITRITRSWSQQATCKRRSYETLIPCMVMFLRFPADGTEHFKTHEPYLTDVKQSKHIFDHDFIYLSLNFTPRVNGHL